MINLLGKGAAVVQVGLSFVLMALAVGIYTNAIDLGWKQPLRYYRDDGKKGPNLLVASLFDRREATVRMFARFRRDQLVNVSRAEAGLSEIEMYLALNHLRGESELARLDPPADQQNAAGEKLQIFDFKYSDSGFVELEPGTSRQLGFPVLSVPVPKVDRSIVGYQAQIKDVDQRIQDAQAKADVLMAGQKEITDRMTGELDKKSGAPLTDKSGSVVRPGWYYLIEAEAKAQRDMRKEAEYLQPLWVKELADAQLVVQRRDRLLRRLQELGDRSYLTQSEFLRKLQ
jgi:hypothetical protein